MTVFLIMFYLRLMRYSSSLSTLELDLLVLLPTVKSVSLPFLSYFFFFSSISTNMSRINVIIKPANCRIVPTLSLYPKLLPISARYDLLSPKEYNLQAISDGKYYKNVYLIGIWVYLLMLMGIIGGTTFKIYAIIVIFV